MRVFVLLCAVALAGCIQRYEAPTEPVTTPTPYSAIALYRQIEPLVGVGGAPLPAAAVRVAARGEDVFADTALLDGPDSAAVAEGWEGVRGLLAKRANARIVLLADPAGRLAVCSQLEDSVERMRLAIRPEDRPLHPMKPVDRDEGSRDPLLGIRLGCPAPEPAAERSEAGE